MKKERNSLQIGGVMDSHHNMVSPQNADTRGWPPPSPSDAIIGSPTLREVASRAVVETDLSETKTETETAKFFRDQDRDQDRSRSQFWLRDRDRQSLRPRPRPQNDVINNFFDFLKKSFWSSYLLMSWFYDYIN